MTNYFAKIKANRFVLENQRFLEGIIGTPCDFEGKACFVNKIIKERQIRSKDNYIHG